MLYQMILSRFIEAFAPNSEEERMQAELSDGNLPLQLAGYT